MSSGKKKHKRSRASAHDSAPTAGAEDNMCVAAVPKRHKVNCTLEILDAVFLEIRYCTAVLPADVHAKSACVRFSLQLV